MTTDKADRTICSRCGKVLLGLDGRGPIVALLEHNEKRHRRRPWNREEEEVDLAPIGFRIVARELRQSNG